MEEVNDLHQGLLGLVLTGHVFKGDTGLFLHIDLGVGLAQIAQAAAHLARHAAEQEGEEQHHDHHGQHPGDEHGDDGVKLLHILGAEAGDVVLLQQVDQPVVPHPRLGDGGTVIGGFGLVPLGGGRHGGLLLLPGEAGGGGRLGDVAVGVHRHPVF